MTTYRFTISKRHIVENTDSTAYQGDREVHKDSSTELLAQQDVSVSLALDGETKHTITLTDTPAHLEFTTDLTVGTHTIAVVPQKSPIAQTDVCVDQMFVDGHLVCATQYDFDQKVLQTDSPLRQMLAPHNHQPHDYVWWGDMYTNDSSYDLHDIFYRPNIVTDHQGEWRMTFTRTADGDLWFEQPGDVEDILWDSTAQHSYRLVRAPNRTQVDADYATYQDQTVTIRDWEAEPGADSSTTAPINMKQGTMEEEAWQGPGTYVIDSSMLVWSSDVIDIATEDASKVVVFSLNEFLTFIKGRWYHENHTVTSVTAS